MSARVIIVGGGAAGFFAAIACAQAVPSTHITILEKGSRFLDKVRVSGGGRCNVTHACFDPREFVKRYPRGQRALLGPMLRFGARETFDWFESHGVPLKAEADGRVFPVSDSSQTIMDCLLQNARTAGVKLRLNAGVEAVERRSDGGFSVRLAPPRPFDPSALAPGAELLEGVQALESERLLLATGGCRGSAAEKLPVSLGHHLEPAVPSLFTFQVDLPWLQSLAGVSVPVVEVAVPTAGLRERGALLVTHWGLSGPAVLKLSAWGARKLHSLDYRFTALVNWMPEIHAEQVAAALNARRQTQPAKQVVNSPLPPVPGRLWGQLVRAAGIAAETRWSAVSRAHVHALTQWLTRSEFAVSGKSLNKEEFVTCGGVRLDEVDFKTMESRICPGLHFAGELLDVDGVTGGFNFQAAWTTGYLAGRAMAGKPHTG